MRISDWSSDVCSSDLPWQAIIGCATGNFGSGRRCRLQRRDDEAVFVKPELGQLALSREDRYLFDGRVEPGDRKRGGKGGSVSVRVEHGGRGVIKNKTNMHNARSVR